MKFENRFKVINFTFYVFLAKNLEALHDESRNGQNSLQYGVFFYSFDKQVLWESAGAFFRATTLVSARKSHSSGVRGLVVRCLPFNPEVSCSNTCVCANFFYKYSEAEGFHFFGTMRLPPFSALRDFFESFLMSPKGHPFNFLIFCNITNFKKS